MDMVYDPNDSHRFNHCSQTIKDFLIGSDTEKNYKTKMEQRENIL